MKLPGIGGHHAGRSITDEWLTPPKILRSLGPFDLDPCAPQDRPWPTAAHHLTSEDDGLDHPWAGRVWLNPPYSSIEPWMRRMAEHGDGIAMVFARCDTRWWFESVWPVAKAILFLKGRITFYRGDGSVSKAGHNSGGPSVLIAYGESNACVLEHCGLPGALVRLEGC